MSASGECLGDWGQIVETSSCTSKQERCKDLFELAYGASALGALPDLASMTLSELEAFCAFLRRRKGREQNE